MRLDMLLIRRLTRSMQFDATFPSVSYCSKVAGLMISKPDLSISSFETV